MTAPSREKLSRLQREVIDRFFHAEQGFFLTGGAALAGYHFGHRSTSDLDLFSLDDEAYARGRSTLEQVAADLGTGLEVKQDAPGFKRCLLTTADDAVLVDLVRERVHQVCPEKLDFEGVRVDPVPEILANKLTTIVSRAEVRDLVDLLVMERAGHDPVAAMDDAIQKDGGCTPATLAWLLSEMTLPDAVRIPGEVTPAELQAFVADLVHRLQVAAFPRTRPDRP